MLNFQTDSKIFLQMGQTFRDRINLRPRQARVTRLDSQMLDRCSVGVFSYGKYMRASHGSLILRPARKSRRQFVTKILSHFG